jgi:hypothetical protein
MITKRLYDSQQPMMVVVLVAAAVLTISSIVVFSNTPQIWALEISIQMSCVNNQPCQTMVCSESQPCRVPETPNTGFEFDADETDNISQPLEGTGTMGLAPFSDPYTNGYSEDQQEYLEERQDIMEDAEYE